MDLHTIITEVKKKCTEDNKDFVVINNCLNQVIYDFADAKKISENPDIPVGESYETNYHAIKKLIEWLTNYIESVRIL